MAEKFAGGENPIPQQTLKGGLYLAGRYGLGVLVSTGNMLVMTRWIGPHAYGLFVTVIGLISVMAAVSRMGVDTYLVRRESVPSNREFATANAIVLLASSVLIVLAVAVVPLLVRWYGSREFVLPYLVLLTTIPVSGLTGVPMAWLERELMFHKIAGLELTGQSLGLVIAVVMASAKMSVWAPVCGQVAWQVFTLVATIALARMPLRLRICREHWRPMCSFGIGMTMSLRTWQLRTLVNPLLVGRAGGPEAVAFVALAIRIAEALGTFRLAAGRIAIAGLARLQNRKDQFRLALQKALWLQMITLGPLLCGFALAGPSLLKYLIGTKWAPSLVIYPFIAVGVLINSIYNLQASALFVLEQHWTVMRSYTLHIALLAGSTWVLLPKCGIAGYGWAELIACSAYYGIHSQLRKVLRISYSGVATLALAFTALLFAPLTVNFISQVLTA